MDGILTELTIYRIEIVVGEEQLNVTPNFYTYDATKIKVGQMPQGYVGLPVDFDSELVFMFYIPDFLPLTTLLYSQAMVQVTKRPLSRPVKDV